MSSLARLILGRLLSPEAEETGLIVDGHLPDLTEFGTVTGSHAQKDRHSAAPGRACVEINVLFGSRKVAEQHEREGAGSPAAIAGIDGAGRFTFARRFILQAGVTQDITHGEVCITVFRMTAQEIPGLYPGILEVA